jgi:hypothetical protein
MVYSFYGAKTIAFKVYKRIKTQCPSGRCMQDVLRLDQHKISPQQMLSNFNAQHHTQRSKTLSHAE